MNTPTAMISMRVSTISADLFLKAIFSYNRFDDAVFRERHGMTSMVNETSRMNNRTYPRPSQANRSPPPHPHTRGTPSVSDLFLVPTQSPLHLANLFFFFLDL